MRSTAALTLVSAEDGPLGRDKHRYFLFINGRWRWRPTKAMKAYGFKLVTMGRGGPGIDPDGNPAPSLEDRQRAEKLNDDWDKVRTGQVSVPARTTLVAYADGSIGRGYQRAMELRKAERKAKGIVWTNEQEKRDSWPRAWKWLERFGHCDPGTMQPEHFLRIDAVTGEAEGLVPEVETKVSITERHMVIKIWRALWKRMGGMTTEQGKRFCDREADPSKSFSNTPPKPRDQVWYRREVHKLVQVAWRNEYNGLAALMAVAWDSQLSPIDNRSLTLAQIRNDNIGIYFAVDRAKTGKAAAATLSRWSQAVLVAYLNGFGAELFDTAPLFWTRGGRPVSRDGAEPRLQQGQRTGVRQG
jgi:hypothetical protein